MGTFNVLDASGNPQSVTNNDNGQEAAAASAPVTLSNENIAVLEDTLSAAEIIANAAQSTAPVNVYPMPATPVSGLTSSMTSTSSTAVTGMGAPGADMYNYITQVTVTNSHASVGTNVELQDGNGGTTFYVIPAAAIYGGATLSFPTPLKQPSANTALYAKNTTTGAAVILSASGFRAA